MEERYYSSNLVTGYCLEISKVDDNVFSSRSSLSGHEHNVKEIKIKY